VEQGWAIVNAVINFGFIKLENLLTSQRTLGFSSKTVLHDVTSLVGWLVGWLVS
jgi:hypothetical protein